ncbi:restriction endonuclease subunit S [Burkholderia diffusa]|nr:restriction endonuclease subunit S [Burkholderia diffusa]
MKNWPRVRLGDVAPICRRPVHIDINAEYPELGIRSFGRGTFQKPPVAGADVGSKKLFEIKSGDLVFSNVFAWEGAVAVARPEDDGRFGSHRFIACVVDNGRADAKFLCSYLTSSEEGLDQIRKASPGGAGRNRTLGLEKLVEIAVPLPPLPEQRAIVAKLDELSDKTTQLNAHLDAIEADADRLLALRFRDAIANAAYRPMREVAPLVRREVEIDTEASYPELGIRSFGKGTFHKPAVPGLELGTKRLFYIEPGDLMFSNVFAWEGAMAIAQHEDAGRVGSHRFMTCVVDSQKIEASFLLYYLLGNEGLEKVREASPGGAGRNRTLGVEKLAKIDVPVPPLTAQREFTALQTAVAALKAKHTAIRQSNTALVPATLERIFGEHRAPAAKSSGTATDLRLHSDVGV